MLGALIWLFAFKIVAFRLLQALSALDVVSCLYIILIFDIFRGFNFKWRVAFSVVI